jgi:hypothetical protein
MRCSIICFDETESFSCTTTAVAKIFLLVYATSGCDNVHQALGYVDHPGYLLSGKQQLYLRNLEGQALDLSFGVS